MENEFKSFETPTSWVAEKSKESQKEKEMFFEILEGIIKELNIDYFCFAVL